MRSLRTALAAMTLVALVLGGQTARADASSSADSDGLRTRAERALAVNQTDDALRSQWEQGYRELLEAQRDARERLESAQSSQRIAKKRHRMRGTVRVDIVTAIDESKAELASATEDVAEFLDRARQAGVVPGWLEAVAEEFVRPAAPR